MCIVLPTSIRTKIKGDRKRALDPDVQWGVKHKRKCKSKKGKEVEQTDQYQKGSKERSKIERKFGEAKQGHGFSRYRYVGEVGFAIQSFLTVMVLNRKRIVKLLTGVNF